MLCGRSAISSASPPLSCRAAERTGVVRCSAGRLSRELLLEQGLWALRGEGESAASGGCGRAEGSEHRIASHRCWRHPSRREVRLRERLPHSGCLCALFQLCAAAASERADPAWLCPAESWGCRLLLGSRFLTGCRSVA